MIADGKLVSARLKQKIIDGLVDKPKKEVVFIIFGNDLASKQFISMKCGFAETLGILARVVEYPEHVTFEEVKEIVSKVANQNISGIVIQLPLPVGLPTQEVLNLVPVSLDIDVLSENAKNEYRSGVSDKIPPVSRAVSEILNFYDIDLVGKIILVIGAGKLVGEPVRNMFELKNIPFQVVDKDTDPTIRENLITKADVIISGAGSPFMIKPDMVKDGVVLIDAGTSEQNGKIVGDVDPSCREKASLLTPVPGGVGPVTLASLFLNL